MPTPDEEIRYCVIGAGASGLTTCKNLLQESIAFDCFERENDLGGNWNFGKPNSSIYDSTHLISSKQLTEFTDFPMPEEYAHYPHHRQVLEYFRSYADEFDLLKHIHFNQSIEMIEKNTNGNWAVSLDGESNPREYTRSDYRQWSSLEAKVAGVSR